MSALEIIGATCLVLASLLVAAGIIGSIAGIVADELRRAVGDHHARNSTPILPMDQPRRPWWRFWSARR